MYKGSQKKSSTPLPKCVEYILLMPIHRLLFPFSILMNEISSKKCRDQRERLPAKTRDDSKHFLFLLCSKKKENGKNKLFPRL